MTMKKIANMIIEEWKAMTPKQKREEAARFGLLIVTTFMFWVSLNIFY